MNVSSLLYAYFEDLSPTNMWVLRRLGRRIFVLFCFVFCVLVFFLCVCVFFFFFLGGGGGINYVKTLSLGYCTFLKCRYSATSVLGIT